MIFYLLSVNVAFDDPIFLAISLNAHDLPPVTYTPPTPDSNLHFYLECLLVVSCSLVTALLSSIKRKSLVCTRMTDCTSIVYDWLFTYAFGNIYDSWINTYMNRTHHIFFTKRLCSNWYIASCAKRFVIETKYCTRVYICTIARR